MFRLMLLPVVLLAMTITGCIVKTDLSPLKFEPPAGDTQSDEDGTWRFEDDFDSCPGFYRCIISHAALGEDFSKCKGLVPADEKTALSAVEACRTGFCTGTHMMPGSEDFDGDSLLDCLFQKCHAAMVGCAAGNGDQPCSEFVSLWDENHAGDDECEYDFAARLCVLDYLEDTAQDQEDSIGKFLSCTATKAVTPGFEEDCTQHCKAGE